MALTFKQKNTTLSPAPPAETDDQRNARIFQEQQASSPLGLQGLINASRPPVNPAGQGDPTNTGIDPGTMDKTATDMQRLVEYAQKTKGENQHYLNTNVQPSVDQLGTVSDAANETDRGLGYSQAELAANAGHGIDAATSGMRGDYGKYAGLMQGLNESDQGGLQDYLGQNNSLLQQLQGMGWKDAASAQGGVDAQNKALSQYEGLMTPQVTAQERLLMETARRKQEQQEQGSRDAVMGDLKARGMGGSGLELTNMLGAQQQNSQGRTLSDLGMQSNAVDRSMQAIQGYGNIAGQMRSAGDIINMFNGQQGQAANEWRASQAAKLANDALTGTTGVNKGIGDRATTAYGAGTDVRNAEYKASADKYGLGRQTNAVLAGNAQNAVERQKGVAGSRLDLGALWTGGNRADSGAVQSGMSAQVGQQVADDAVRKAESETPFLDLPFINGKNRFIG
jgi:hypothetical protein